MKGLATTLLGIAGSLGVALLMWSMNADRYDVRFTISEQIPLRLIGQNPAEAVQQLTVKNLGNRRADGVRVKISADIAQLELVKHSEAAAPKIFNTNALYELVYGDLPPDGAFR